MPVPSDRIETIQEEMSASYQKYGSIFRDRDEFDLFWMLPLSDEQRLTLVNCMLKEKKQALEVEDCEGDEWSTDTHRQLCIECVTKFRPSCASPYY